MLIPALVKLDEDFRTLRRLRYERSWGDIKSEEILSNGESQLMREGLKEGKGLMFELEEWIFLPYGAHMDI